MVTAAMILLILRVLDCIVQALVQSVCVRAILTDPLIVLLEIVDSLDFLEFGLQFIFHFEVEATMIVVDALLEL